jgi:putative NIF3 family GTP cyclohydrolase 1 type 2
MNNSSSILNRRKFIAASATTAGVLLATPLVNKAAGFIKTTETYTVQQVIDLFIKDVPGGVLPVGTVDTLKSGSGDTIVTGIVTTMFATIDVIYKTIAFGANFIIAHEPTFYNHVDDTKWLQNDDVYEYKAKLLKDNGITVWRNHDYIHHLKPDGVMMGVLAQMNWTKYADKETPNILTVPSMSVKDLVTYTKDKLHIEKVRFIGDPAQTCTKVLFMEGAAGGQRQITAIGKVKPDVVIIGEISEWETAEYIRDARAKGDKISLIVIGHIASEEPGSEFMLGWLRQHFPSIKAKHILSGNSLTFL